MYKLREIKNSDNTIIASMIQSAFAGYPWFEKLTYQECLGRIDSDIIRSKFFGLIGEINGEVISGNWTDVLTLELLEEQRGSELRHFVEKLKVNSIVWERDLVVHPEYQKKGYGKLIRSEVLKTLARSNDSYIFTRMRQDNYGVIKIAKELGYTQTGIIIPSSQEKDLSHEYWYINLS